MTTTIVYERLHNYKYSLLPFEQTQSSNEKSYYELYQLKLRQKYSKSNDHSDKRATYSKQKQPKLRIKNNNPNKEYMNRQNYKMKLQQIQDDDGTKRSSSVISVTHRRTKYSVTSTVVSAYISSTDMNEPIEPKARSNVKQKHPFLISKRQRIESAPIDQEQLILKTKAQALPKIQIDHNDNDLLKSNGNSYTLVSSSSQHHIHDDQQHTQQSVLNTIILHLNKHVPCDLATWDLYHSFDEKFFSSISPSVYRDFERTIV